MTAREVFEGALIEVSKVKSSTLLLEDFNYLFNKAINQYVNQVYSIYDVGQQTTDDLRVLKTTSILKPELTKKYPSPIDGEVSAVVSSNNAIADLYGNVYEFNLPADYLHMLNCICVFKVKKNIKCYDKGSYISFPATRISSDEWAQVITDYYNKPSYKRPYVFIHNVNLSNGELTNPYDKNTGYGTDQYIVQTKTSTQGADGSWSEPEVIRLDEFDRTTTISGLDTSTTTVSSPGTITLTNVDLVNKNAGLRHSNPTNVRCEIRYGKDNSIFELVQVSVDYIKSPQRIRLTQEQLDLTEDTSQVMEFPDYVCQEIINRLTLLVMENSSDPRIQTFPSVSTSIQYNSQGGTQPRQQAAPSKD